MTGVSSVRVEYAQCAAHKGQGCSKQLLNAIHCDDFVIHTQYIIALHILLFCCVTGQYELDYIFDFDRKAASTIDRTKKF